MFLKIIKLKKIFRLVLLSALLILPFACEDMDMLFVDCNDCYTTEPEYADITLKLTINDENSAVYYEVYYGKIEDNNFWFSDTAYSEEVAWSAPVNEYYSVKAFYYSKGREIIAVDGTNLRTKYDQSSCSSDCYLIRGDVLNAKFKY
mgnify:FL=1